MAALIRGSVSVVSLLSFCLWRHKGDTQTNTGLYAFIQNTIPGDDVRWFKRKLLIFIIFRLMGMKT